MGGEWISVNTRMPEKGVRCIISERIPARYVIDGEPKDGHDIQFGMWEGDHWKSFHQPGTWLLRPSVVSHWMPIPAPPNEVQSR